MDRTAQGPSGVIIIIMSYYVLGPSLTFTPISINSNQEIEKINFATSDSEKRLKNWVERESGLGMIQGLTVNSTYNGYST